jgi:hypothetical protein
MRFIYNEPFARFMAVTPQLAKEFLKHNTGNYRKPVQSNVAKLKRTISAGQFKTTNQGIGFDTTGKLIDGQQRCMAISEMDADTVVTILVTFGLEPDAEKAIDTGLSRQNALVLQNEYGVKSASLVQAIILAERDLLYGSRMKLSAHELYTLYLRQQEAIDWITSAITAGPTRLAFVFTALVFAYQQLKQYPGLDRVVEALRDGANLTKNDPLLKLRNYCLDKAHNADKRPDQTLKALTALMYAVQGKQLEKGKLYAKDSAKDFFGLQNVDMKVPGEA